MRQEILTELKAKKKKAGKVVSQSSTVGRKAVDDGEPRTTGSTILAALEKAGL
jgi:putative IMPACT (imprinted ancient) family translation regulator